MTVKHGRRAAPHKIEMKGDRCGRAHVAGFVRRIPASRNDDVLLYNHAPASSNTPSWPAAHSSMQTTSRPSDRTQLLCAHPIGTSCIASARRACTQHERWGCHGPSRACYARHGGRCASSARGQRMRTNLRHSFLHETHVPLSNFHSGFSCSRLDRCTKVALGQGGRRRCALRLMAETKMSACLSL